MFFIDYSLKDHENPCKKQKILIRIFFKVSKVTMNLFLDNKYKMCPGELLYTKCIMVCSLSIFHLM